MNRDWMWWYFSGYNGNEMLVASRMSFMASLVTTSRMQQCLNVLIDICHEFMLLFYCCVLLEIKLTTTTTTKCRQNYCVIVVIYVRLRQKKYLILKQTACRRITGNRMLSLEAICVRGDWGHILGFQETKNRSCRLCAHQQESYSNGRHIMTITNRWPSTRLQ